MVFRKDKQVLLTSVRNGDLFGQFVFPKLVLRDRGLLSKNGQGGKLAIRVYPPWDNTVNMQAQKTQKWQLEYFLAIDISIDYGAVPDNTKMCYVGWYEEESNK